MTKTTITVPVNGVAVAAVSTIETVPYWTRSRKRSGKNEYLFNTFCELEGFFFPSLSLDVTCLICGYSCSRLGGYDYY